MTDLQVNIALAKAMGWKFLSQIGFAGLKKTGFIVEDDEVICGYNFCLLNFKFDYRDPVIFVAICKHWKLDVNFHKSRVDGFVNENLFSQLAYRHEANISSMEKAAALVVIEHVKHQTMLDKLAKRGVK